MHRLAAAAGGGVCVRHQAQALFPGGGHGRHPVRAGAAVHRRQLSGGAGSRHAGGRGLIGVPPRIQPGGAHGVGRALWAGAIAVPGGRQCRLGPGALVRGIPGRHLWTALHRLVCRCGAAGDHHPVQCRHLVQASRPHAHQASPWRAPFPPVEEQDRLVPGRAAGDGVFQVRLPDQHRQLLHLLPDPQFRPVGAGRADSPVLLPGLGGGGHVAGRAAGR